MNPFDTTNHERVAEAVRAGLVTIQELVEQGYGTIIEDCLVLNNEPWCVTSEGDGHVFYPYDEYDDPSDVADAYIDGGDWGEDEVEIRVLVWRNGINDEGDVVQVDPTIHTITVNEGGPALARQREMTIVAEDEEEFVTHVLGKCKDGWHGVHYYTWTRNGGSRGALDRTCGDGVWREKYEMPRIMDIVDVVRVLDKKYGWEDSEITNEIRNWANDDSKVVRILKDAGWDGDRIMDACDELGEMLVDV